MHSVLEVLTGLLRTGSVDNADPDDMLRAVFVIPEDMYSTILQFLDEPERAAVTEWLAG